MTFFNLQWWQQCGMQIANKLAPTHFTSRHALRILKQNSIRKTENRARFSMTLTSHLVRHLFAEIMNKSSESERISGSTQRTEKKTYTFENIWDAATHASRITLWIIIHKSCILYTLRIAYIVYHNLLRTYPKFFPFRIEADLHSSRY